ncbi:MAG: GNAT family N-acetyltransferase [Bacteroidales bacterium]|nr:GNAT family N-acetyltransferase [Bacteroidales bacterium]
MALNSLTIRILDNVSQLDDFNCGIKAMDDFIHSGLANSVRNHYCNLYSVTLDNEIVAMFSLSFDSLELDLDSLEEILDNQSSSNKPNLSSNYVDTFLSKHHYPALEISYLAVKENYRRKGIGKAVVDSIAEMAQRQKTAGCMFLTVEAYIEEDYSAVPFYNACHFEPCEYKKPDKETLRMFRTLFPKNDHQ